MNRESSTQPQWSWGRRSSFSRHESGRTLLSGEILRINAASSDDGSWILGAIMPNGDSRPIAFLAKGVGGLLAGRLVQVDGFWERHPKYGEQFLVERCVSSELPRERAALLRYLTANVAGLGKRRSEQLIAALGETVLQKIKQDPGIVKRVFPGGLGERIVWGVTRWRESENAEQWSVEVAPRLMAAGDIHYSQAKK